MSSLAKLLKGPITKDQSRDTGMAMVLLMLLLFTGTRRNWALAAAIILHVVNMTAPQVFQPVARLWLSLSHVLGMVMSKVILSVVFFVVVTPIGILRRLMGADSLNLRKFKSGNGSVMVQRNHTFTGNDIVKPY